MKSIRWLLYALAIALGLVGIYTFTLGGQFVIVGVALYILCWIIAWLARRF